MVLPFGEYADTMLCKQVADDVYCPLAVFCLGYLEWWLDSTLLFILNSVSVAYIYTCTCMYMYYPRGG